MTRKNYIAMASAIRCEHMRVPGQRDFAERAARVFADIAQADNARFDRARFMAACGLGKENDNGN